MNYAFIDKEHKKRYLEFTKKTQINEYDLERQTLFYIVCGNEDLYKKRHYIYDICENTILSDCITSGEVDFCSSSRALIRLAFNLYNGCKDYFTDPLSILVVLDSKNLFLAYQALLIRMNAVVVPCAIQIISEA